MRFWDASAVVPLVVEEGSSHQLRSLAMKDREFVVWWGSLVECTSAIARRQRLGSLDGFAAAGAFQQLQQLSSRWREIEPVEAVREAAVRFVRVHDLRAADALQLAAALVGAEGRPHNLEFVSLDDRLLHAAHTEGFVVVDFARL